jgi:hypothetical protein
MTPEQLKRLEEIKYTIEVSEETQWLIAQLEAEAGENVILRAAQKNTLSSRDAWKTEAEAAEADAARLRKALECIAANNCCDTCREAALVACKALAPRERGGGEWVCAACGRAHTGVCGVMHGLITGEPQEGK